MHNDKEEFIKAMNDGTYGSKSKVVVDRLVKYECEICGISE